MLQPGLLSMRPSSSSDPENPGMALGLGGRPGQGMMLWQKSKCLHLSLEATQIRPFFFVELSFESQKITLVPFSYFPLNILFFRVNIPSPFNCFFNEFHIFLLFIFYAFNSFNHLLSQNVPQNFTMISSGSTESSGAFYVINTMT